MGVGPYPPRERVAAGHSGAATKAGTCMTARRVRIASHYEFATHSPRWSAQLLRSGFRDADQEVLAVEF